MLNYYKILEIPDGSLEPEIKKAYRSLSKKYHPDLNADPAAHNYFLKINEAYDFLMNENKRFLLNQYLQSVKQVKNQQQSYQQNTQQPKQQSQDAIPQPIIKTFFCDRKSFSLNDHIYIKWEVYQCKSVSINVFGNVANHGGQYYKVNKFVSQLKIVLRIVGLDDRIYTSEIILNYFNDKPGMKAYHEMLSKNPETKEIHFKQEKYLFSHARISRLTFVNRFIVLAIVLLITTFLFVQATHPQFLFIILCSVIATIWVQCVKRLHDLKAHKHKVWELAIPILNFKIIKDLFSVDSEKGSNEFGVYPKQEQKPFKDWMLYHIKWMYSQLTNLQKIAIGMYIALLMIIGYQSVKDYEEYEATLTGKQIETSRPTDSGRVSKYYFIEFNNDVWIEVTENEFASIIYDKNYDRFVLGINTNNEIKYVKGFNTTDLKATKKFGAGFLSNANPAIIILTIMFLGQLYVISQFKSNDEKFYGNIYLVFTIIVYFFTIVSYLI